ncbi:unnamed protein product [Oikopleura dioica]|uniref:Uncharacterized protein n=1 Tax=Oikopleura dioica TaxID=34765 RepID=E4WSZ9_OIKDI|nr:unnamed protein product [Oikopleura dioica]
MGFYYDNNQGFYYAVPAEGKAEAAPAFAPRFGGFVPHRQGFYYDQQRKSKQGFYYDRFDGETAFAAAWQENEDAKRALDAAEKEATKKVSIFAVKNKQSPNQVQNRILGNIAGERLAYEACEIYMNETAPNELSADEIRAEIFEVVKKAITADE